MATAYCALLCCAVLALHRWQAVRAAGATGDNSAEVFVDDDWLLRRSYRLEDFLWSGSGDGATDAPAATPLLITTVFRTTTVLATVFPTPLDTPSYPAGGQQPAHTPVWETPAGSITPTPTLKPPLSTYFYTTAANNTNTTQVGTPDERYWLLTVIVANKSIENNTFLLETRLASIYKVAFTRQQERHLGLGNATAAKQMQSRQRREQQTLSVHVHNVSVRENDISLKSDWSDAKQEIELLYSVRVDGRPVLAQAAAADMRLVTEQEVAAELGFPVLTKAEPYLKASQPLNGGAQIARARDTWLLVAAAVSAVCLLLLLVALIALGLGKRKHHRIISTNRQQVFEQEGGVSNLGYQNEGPDTQVKGKPWRPPPSQPPASSVSFQDDGGRSSSANSSQASLVRRRATPVATRDEDDEDRPKPKPRKRQHLQGSSLIKRVHSENDESTKEDDIDGSMEELVGLPQSISKRSAVSPSSLLSMPSVKSFPRGANIPEPLARVLDPAATRPTDAGGVVGLAMRPAPRLSRHGSVEGEDPGVVGPLVWDLHCNQIICRQNINRGGGYDEEANADGLNELTGPDTTASNVGRMRRRFNELLDDAFSLFGSRSVSPDDTSSSPPQHAPGTHRVHSAIVRPVGEPLDLDSIRRPRTSESRRPATAGVTRPRGAWATREPSVASAHSTSLPRPLSAGPFHRPQITMEAELVIERDMVLADSRLPPTDPAVPLIAAIKEELRKFHDAQPAPALPGSATGKP